MMKIIITSILILNLGSGISASLLRGEKYQRRSLSQQCVALTDENSCIDDEACTWCEFKYQAYQPTCLPKTSISSLPAGFYTCNTKEQQQPTLEPTSSRNGVPDRPEILTSGPSFSLSSNPSMSPSTTPSQERQGGGPPLDEDESEEEGANTPCYFWDQETPCVDRACAWCEFKYDAYEPVCLRTKDISSLPAGFYTCKKQRPAQPTQEPTQERNGANPRPDVNTTTSPSSSDNVVSSATPSAAPTPRRGSAHPSTTQAPTVTVSPSAVVARTTTEPSLSPTIPPSFSRNGGTPTDGVEPTESPVVEKPLNSCYDAREETRCKQREACKWCEFKYDAYQPTCLEAKDLSSLPAGFFTCT